MSRLCLFAGGGTGGHVFPGLAVAEALRERGGWECAFIGSERPGEAGWVRDAGFEHVPLPVEPLSTLWRRPWRFVSGNRRALIEAARIANERRAAAIVGLGGYASVPGLRAAYRPPRPLILLEQNVIPGRVTRWWAKSAATICISFEATREFLPRSARTVVTGNPVRPSVAALASQPRFEPAQPTLLILGGSQGAAALNDAVLQLVSAYRPWFEGWSIIHQTGAQQEREVRAVYKSLRMPAETAAFFPDMAAVYRRATLAFARAGATTLAELACAGLPSILVPYPRAADDHQRANAREFHQAGAALIAEQGEHPNVTAGRIAEACFPLMSQASLRGSISEAARRLARADAAGSVAEIVIKAVTPRRASCTSRPN